MPESIFDALPMPPVAKTLGWTLRAIDPDAGTIEIGFTAGEAFTNPTGAVQGGFIRPARPGAFVGKGRVVSLGKTIAFLEGELFDAGGELVARATATARVLPSSSILP
jgi:acyl-coenzyme A thioesterase PaaI-like protein